MSRLVKKKFRFAAVACSLSLGVFAWAEGVKQIEVPAGDLVSALESLSKQTNVELVFQPEHMRGLHTQGVSGAFSSQEAVRRLLEGTALQLQIDGKTGAMMIGPERPSKTANAGSVRSADGSFRDELHLAQAPGASSGAQESQGDATADSGFKLEEVVVTAQKRAEKLRDVPISIGVQTAADLEKFHAVQLSDYAGYIAGVTVVNYSYPGANRVVLRGLGLLQGATPLVSTYLDDSPIGGVAGQFGGGESVDVNPYDLERVEVLRGPQGTLWGASSISGMLRYVSVQPDLNRFSARTGADFLTLSKSSDLGYAVRGAINIPLIEGKLALRGSASRTENPGFIDNTVTGKRDENRSTFDAGGLTLLWQARDSLSIKLQARLQRVDARGLGDVNFIALQDGQGNAEPGGLINDNLTDSYALPNSQVTDLQRFALNINWNLGFANLFSTSAYSEQNTDGLSDVTDFLRSAAEAVTGVTGGYVSGQTGSPRRRFVQEFRLASPQNQRMEWIFGVFYNDETLASKGRFFAFDSSVATIPGFPSLLNTVESYTYQELATFGSATYKVTPRLDLTAGLRWAQNKQSYVQNEFRGPYADWCCGGEANALTPSGKSKTHATSYALSSRYYFHDDGMVYARIATGFRPGGPTLIPGSTRVFIPDAPYEYQSDTATNYEIGLKSDFAHHRLQLEASVFRIDMTDTQTYGGFLGTDNQTYYIFINGGKARSDGVELSAVALPTRGLQMTATLGYSKPTYLSEQTAFGIAKGDTIPGAAPWTGSIAADYSRPVSAAWTAAVGGGVRYMGKHTDFSDVNKPSRASTFTDLNAVLSNDSWRVALYVRNLFDKRAYNHIQNNLWNPDPAYGAYYYAGVSQPRTVGLSIDRSFD